MATGAKVFLFYFVFRFSHLFVVTDEIAKVNSLRSINISINNKLSIQAMCFPTALILVKNRDHCCVIHYIYVRAYV